MKQLTAIRHAPDGHWVGDGFPVRSLFDYTSLGQQISPFLLLDYAGPAQFTPSHQPPGVGEHPHRGFETVTIVYAGEVAHRDSTGQGGVIGPGDVQWMTAGSGILHDEFHSPAFTRNGGTLEMVQLWINLPARDKMAAPHYQNILSRDIPVVALGSGSSLRVIAGDYAGQNGPARTFSPLSVWDIQLKQGTTQALPVPDGHNAVLVVRRGQIDIGEHTLSDAQTALFAREGNDITLHASEDSTLLLLSGQPLDEPIAGHGPFVMNTQDEIRQAIEDFRSGRFGQITPA